MITELKTLIEILENSIPKFRVKSSEREKIENGSHDGISKN